MPNNVKYDWDTITDLTVTNLASLADGNIWQSGDLDPGDPSPGFVKVSYELVFNATPVAGDRIDFLYASCDEAASNEIRDGNIGGTEGQITTAAAKAAVQASCPVVRSHYWETSHGTTFKGSFIIPNPGPSWQLLIKPVGEAFAAGTHRVRIRYTDDEVQ